MSWLKFDLPYLAYRMYHTTKLTSQNLIGKGADSIWLAESWDPTLPQPGNLAPHWSLCILSSNSCWGQAGPPPAHWLGRHGGVSLWSTQLPELLSTLAVLHTPRSFQQTLSNFIDCIVALAQDVPFWLQAASWKSWGSAELLGSLTLSRPKTRIINTWFIFHF